MTASSARAQWAGQRCPQPSSTAMLLAEISYFHLCAHASSQPCVLEDSPAREAWPRTAWQDTTLPSSIQSFALLPFPEGTETPE